MSATVLSSLTNTISGIKFQTINDIPNLQLWLDASDGNTIISEQLLGDEVWYFNGTNGNYLSIPSNNVFNFVSGTFTIECWVMFTALPSQTMIVTNYNSTSTGWYLQQINSKFIGGFSGDGIELQGTTTIQLNTWYHVAVSGSVGSYKLFVNGIQEGATYTGPTVLGGGTLGIGAFGSRFPGQRVHNGYMSNLRVVNGKALYTTDFNPFVSAAVPLQSISEPGVITPLLVLQDPTVTVNNGNVPGITLTSFGTFTSIAPGTFFVPFWLDKSPNALTASQTIVNNRTSLLSSEVNGLNVVNFDGVDDHFNLSSPIFLSGNYSHFFVYKRPPSIPSIPINVSLGNKISDNQSAFLHWYDNNIYSSNRYTNSPVASAGTLIGGLRKNEYIQVDLEPKPFTNTWVGTKTASVNTLGIYSNSFYQKGLMCEIIHTGSMLPNEEINLVNRKLYDKWKVPKQVPFLRTTPILSTGTSTSAISSTLGTWYVEPTSYRVEWIRSLDNVNFTAIVNTLSSYTNPLSISVYNPTLSDFGAFIKTSVSATNSFGTGVF